MSKTWLLDESSSEFFKVLVNFFLETATGPLNTIDNIYSYIKDSLFVSPDVKNKTCIWTLTKDEWKSPIKMSRKKIALRGAADILFWMIY